MVSSIGNTATDSIQLMMAQMYQKLNAADTDGTAGLSKDELSSIDAGDDKGGSAFLKSLSSQFDSLDADGNGQLSASEIASAKPHAGQMGPPPGMTIDGCCSKDETASTDATNSASATATSVEQWLEKMLQSVVDSFAKSTGTTTSDSQTTTSNEISSLTSTADTDKSGSLSSDELASVDTSSNSGQAKFVKDLISNFKSYDTNGDGLLSQSEMTTAASNSNAISLGSSIGNSLANLSSSFVQKLLNSYQTSNLSA